jgi:DNA-binding response OmpR family regulator
MVGSHLRILVVDDDLVGSRMVQFLLQEQGHVVELVDNPRGALAMIEKQSPDLMLLDVNLPQINGFDLYQRLRQRGYDFPVIFLTGKDEVEDRVQGLTMGADDYICKPFHSAEFIARVEAVMRRYARTRTTEQGQILAGEVEIDPRELRVTLPDRRTAYLTPTEMKVLLQLAQHAGEPVERGEVLASVWGEHNSCESNIVDVYVRRLRRKLERDPARPRLIQAARGVGYKFGE